MNFCRKGPHPPSPKGKAGGAGSGLVVEVEGVGGGVGVPLVSLVDGVPFRFGARVVNVGQAAAYRWRPTFVQRIALSEYLCRWTEFPRTL